MRKCMILRSLGCIYLLHRHLSSSAYMETHPKRNPNREVWLDPTKLCCFNNIHADKYHSNLLCGRPRSFIIRRVAFFWVMILTILDFS